MKMELIQPFINAADAVLAELLACNTRIGDLNMEEEAYRRKGVAAVITIRGDIEGRVIFDLAPSTAVNVAAKLAGAPMEESEELVRETIFELANQIIGNAVTSLNDAGFRFRISPPGLHAEDRGTAGSEDTEALVICLDTPSGSVFMNIAMHYNRRRKQEREAVVVA
ncbi:MAG: chemotaxis protein CheX [Terriglobales bacterium]